LKTPDAGSQFHRLRRIVLAALEQPAAERDAFLAKECRSEAELGKAQQLLGYDSEYGRGLESDENPQNHETIGRYPVQRQIGSGGMGWVYLATDPTLQREIAIKRLPAWLDQDPAALDRFREEARLLAQLNHSHIATLYSFETGDGLSFLTMEYVPGQALSDVLRNGPLEVGRALKILRGVASALEAAHARGIAHRDLKPHNIVVTEQDEAKVLDFGLAQEILVDSTPLPHDPETLVPFLGSDASPHSWTSAGTPGYMSPERLRPASSSEGLESARTNALAGDCWAFGCVAFECLAGMRAFGGSREERIRSSLGNSAPLEAIPSHVPSPIVRLIEQCLVKDPSQRLSNLRAARRVIETVAEQRALSQLQESQPDSSPLPRYHTSFRGRRDELEQTRAHLENHPLVTLVGFGGGGKTRLAIEALTPSGRTSRWVDLAPIEKPEQVLLTLLASVGADVPGSNPLDQLCTILADRDEVLLVDNCEHQIPACLDIFPDILRRCPKMSILATSREPIGVEGESVLRISPLPTPTTSTIGDTAEAVQLFLDRARAVQPRPIEDSELPTVVDICHHLDGLPLALEIAASQLDVCTLTELHERLGQRLELSGVSHRERHRSLRAAMDWSFQRLKPLEQEMLMRMSVFAGSWTLGAAEAVGVANQEEPWRAFDLVKTLLRKSLLQRSYSEQDEGPSRYRLLETVAQFSREQLDSSGKIGETQHAMFYFYRDLFRKSRRGPKQQEWMRRFLQEETNLNRLLERMAPEAENDGRMQLRSTETIGFLATLAPHFVRSGRSDHGLRHCERVLARFDASGEPATAALVELFSAMANMSCMTGKVERGLDLARRALSEAQRLGEPRLLGAAYSSIGTAERFRDRHTEALESLDRSLEAYDEREHPRETATVRFSRGVALLHLGRSDESKLELERSLQLRRGIGDESGIADSINALGAVAALQGRFEEARQRYEESLAIKSRLDLRAGMVISYINLSRTMLNLFESLEKDANLLDRSLHFSREGIALAKRIGNRVNLPTLYFSRSAAHSMKKEYDRAEEAANRGMEEARAVGSKSYEGMGYDILAKLELERDHPEEAWACAKRSLEMYAQSSVVSMYQALRTMGHARAALDDFRGAVILLECSRVAAEQSSAKNPRRFEILDEAIEEKARDLLGEETFHEAKELGRCTKAENVLTILDAPT